MKEDFLKVKKLESVGFLVGGRGKGKVKAIVSSVAIPVIGHGALPQKVKTVFL